MVRREWGGVGLMVLATLATRVAMGGTQKQELIGVAAEEPVSVMAYVVASPRAFVVGVPIEGSNELAAIGAAENFPRADGEMEVAAGTRVIFSLSQNTQGTWQNATQGTIETALTIQRFQAAQASDCDACAGQNLDAEPVPPGTKPEPGKAAPCPWITIATDGARDTRTGPSLGYTKVGVPVEFTEPGIYCVRGIVSTSVKSWSPRLLGAAAAEPTTLLAIDTDVVLVKVRVLDRLAPGTKPQGPTTADPDATYLAPMPNTGDTKADAAPRG